MASISNFPLSETVAMGGFDTDFPAPTVALDGQVVPFAAVGTSVDDVDTEMSTFANAQDAATEATAGNGTYADMAYEYFDPNGICSPNDAVLLEFIRRKNQGSR